MGRVDLFMMGKLRPQKLYGQMIFCRSIDHRKFFVEYLQKTILELHPKNILELGSGDGINLLALAVLNPSIKEFTGIELTENGITSSKYYLKNPPYEALIYITEKSREVIAERLVQSKINFIQGDITKMPFKDQSFEFLFSMWVLEQIPRDYPIVFKEARRVLKGHALFMEAFSEAQENFFQRLHLRNLDYFRASFREAGKANLNILRFEPMAITKIKFTSGALLCSS